MRSFKEQRRIRTHECTTTATASTGTSSSCTAEIRVALDFFGYKRQYDMHVNVKYNNPASMYQTQNSVPVLTHHHPHPSSTVHYTWAEEAPSVALHLCHAGRMPRMAMVAAGDAPSVPWRAWLCPGITARKSVTRESGMSGWGGGTSVVAPVVQILRSDPASRPPRGPTRAPRS